MTVTYHFSSLVALADHFEARAADLRDRSDRNKQHRAAILGEAAAYEACAHTVRNTIIEDNSK